MTITARIVAIVCLTVLPSLAFGQTRSVETPRPLRSLEDDNHNRSYQGLYDDVRSVITERKQIETVRGKTKWGSKERSTTSTFDRQGRELERLVYAVRGFPTKTVNRYDLSGRLTVTEKYASNSELMATENYVYSPDGLLREITESNGIRLRLEYDSEGRLIREYGFDGATDEGPRFVPITRRTEFRYDPKGRLLEQAYFNSDGSSAAGLVTHIGSSCHTTIRMVVARQSLG
jgi:YD repeat-containing protein